MAFQTDVQWYIIADTKRHYDGKIDHNHRVPKLDLYGNFDRQITDQMPMQGCRNRCS